MESSRRLLNTVRRQIQLGSFLIFGQLDNKLNYDITDAKLARRNLIRSAYQQPGRMRHSFSHREWRMRHFLEARAIRNGAT